MKASRNPIRRPNMRRAVILFPSGFTLGNLFFGIFAIIAASRGEFTQAGVYVILGGLCDALDGRVARATNSGSEFGEELDSLVDAISFGLAPAIIMYFAVLNRDGWDWIFVFLFSACAVLRLARFNIEQAGTAKTYFRGLPSPAAGITLASYYWFSQSWLYDYSAIGNLPWTTMLRYIMVGLAILMISPVPYPNFPRTGFRNIKAALASLLLITCAVLFFWVHRLEFFFPLALIYVFWGLFRWVFFELFERRQPTVPYDLSEGEDDEDDTFEVPEPARPPRGGRDEATSVVARADRGRSRAERPERTERPARSERPVRPAAVSPDRPAASDDDAPRPERPQRTEAERAARREKREKRDKREPRPDRPPRPERGDRANVTVLDDDTAPAALVVEATPVMDIAATAALDDQVIGVIPGGADDGAAGDGAPARKRKRRRRRGARDRSDAAGRDAGADEGGDDARDDGPGSDDGGETETRSPYATVSPEPVRSAPPRSDAPATEPVRARPFTPPLPTPSPAPAPAAGPSSPEPAE